MTLETEIIRNFEVLRERIELTERAAIIREIQAFASSFGHAMTKDDVTRDVVIVEQLLDFLNKPHGE